MAVFLRQAGAVLVLVRALDRHRLRHRSEADAEKAVSEQFRVEQVDIVKGCVQRALFCAFVRVSVPIVVVGSNIVGMPRS